MGCVGLRFPMSESPDMGHPLLVLDEYLAPGHPTNLNRKRKIDVCGLPPFREETAEGWGTRALVAFKRMGHLPDAVAENYRVL